MLAVLGGRADGSIFHCADGVTNWEQWGRALLGDGDNGSVSFLILSDLTGSLGDDIEQITRVLAVVNSQQTRVTEGPAGLAILGGRTDGILDHGTHDITGWVHLLTGRLGEDLGLGVRVLAVVNVEGTGVSESLLLAGFELGADRLVNEDAGLVTNHGGGLDG